MTSDSWIYIAFLETVIDMYLRQALMSNFPCFSVFTCCLDKFSKFPEDLIDQYNTSHITGSVQPEWCNQVETTSDFQSKRLTAFT